MVEDHQFNVGDVVSHRIRPEWGQGTVRVVQRAMHEGRPTQRVVVDFANRGRVTLLTAVAPLIDKDAIESMRMQTTSGTKGQGWLGSLGEKQRTNELTALPEALTDPFSSDYRRLKATLETFKFSQEPRSLIDWAVAQTGLTDPLTKYTRHELEEAFPYYAHARQAHLNDLVRTMKREGGLETINRAMRETNHRTASEALRKAMKA